MKVNTFRTEITCPSAYPIGLKHRLLTTGSCFADQFGQWLYINKFDVLVNPFGTNYNPVSIHKSLEQSISLQLNEQLFVERLGIWHHFDFHSQWSSHLKEDLQSSILEIQHQVNQHIRKTDVLIITLEPPGYITIKISTALYPIATRFLERNLTNGCYLLKKLPNRLGSCMRYSKIFNPTSE